MKTQANTVPDPAEKTSDQFDKWVNAVLDLVKLTNQDKLVWKRTSDPSVHTDEYEARLADKTFRLEKKFLESDFEYTSSRLDIFGSRNSEPRIKRRVYPYLRIYDSSRNLLASFPDIAPLKALVNAVESQVAGEEYGVLNEIHEAAEMA